MTFEAWNRLAWDRNNRLRTTQFADMHWNRMEWDWNNRPRTIQLVHAANDFETEWKATCIQRFWNGMEWNGNRTIDFELPTKKHNTFYKQFLIPASARVSKSLYVKHEKQN